MLLRAWASPLASILVLGGIFWLISGERGRARLADFDIRGTILATGGMLLLVFTLVKAPDRGWGSTLTIAELTGAFVLLAAFVVNEQRSENAIATSHTQHLLAADTPLPHALTAGFQRALLAGSIFLFAAAVVGLRTGLR